MPPPSLSHKFRTRALNKASQLWTQSSDYLAPAAEGISRSISDLRERREWDTPDGVLTTPKGVLPRGRQASLPSPSSVLDEGSMPNVAQAIAGSRWGGLGAITGYFAAGAREKRDSRYYSEEKIVSFPGYGTLRPSAHGATEPALVLDVLAHGYCYRLRPISQASRSQRVFYALAKSFAALPKIPAGLAQPGQANDDAGQSVESLGLTGTGMEDGNVFERLLDIGAREGERTEEPEEMQPPAASASASAATPAPVAAETEGGPDPSPPLVDQPAKIARRPRITTATSSSSLPQVARLSRPSSISGPSPAPRPKAASTPNPRSPTTSGTTTPNRSTPSHSRQSSLSSSPLHPTVPHNTHDSFPKPFTFTDSDLPRLHANLQARLVPFFGQKLAGRRVRLSVYPTLPSGSLWDQPLATKVVTTSSGGGFRTNIEVRSRELRKLLDESKEGVESLDGLTLRVVAELLENDPIQDVMTGGGLLGHQGLRVTAEDDSELLVGKDGGVRVISDIDDTIKWTEVLGGSKNIFRNVFVRELDEIRVPGMAKWYQAMEKLGVHFHYVSNSPWELWPVIRAYLVNAGFPLGSVTLKEYGGASSAVAKLWEEPGMRKRAGVEAIIKEFSDCRFILVGDSGEQDLNLYVALAQTYPSHVLAIYIRDVTTPLHPSSASPTSPTRSNTSSSVSSAGPPPSFSEFPDLPGQFDGSHEKPIPSQVASTPESPKQNPTPLSDAQSDPLSPNNPLRPVPPPPSLTEEKEALIQAFYARIAAAEKVLPKEIPLRIFRHGAECQMEAMPKSAKRLLRASRGEADADDDDSEEEESIDRLTAEDAYLFPILGSVVLGSLFLAFKYLGKDLINQILGYYFLLVGTGGVARMLSVGVKAGCSPSRWKGLTKWTLSLKKGAADYSSLSFTYIDVGSIAAAVVMTAVNRVFPHWTLQNFVALSLSFNAISLLRLDSFWTGSALLSGLFLWVFGTSVMESVARDFDAPIKIVWPKDLSSPGGFTLLGLGDIVLPGIFIALCLRFDYSNALRAALPPKPSSGFSRPYFLTCFIAYIMGLATTIFVMHTFKAAQPALLYLSPACIVSVIGCAFFRGELALFWGYDDGEHEEKARDADKVAEKDAVAGDDAASADEPATGVSSAVETQDSLKSRQK
ncbi:hypothetical protein RQP46_006512 [Phenoliferia psychrophenolica]